MFELSAVQLGILGAVSVAFVQVYKLWLARGGQSLSKKQLTWGSFVVATVFGALWSNPDWALLFPEDALSSPELLVPALQNVLAQLGALFAQASAAVFVVYEYLLKKVMENIGFV